MKKNIFIEFKDSIFNLNSYSTYHKQTLKRSFFYLLFITILIGSFALIRPIQDFNALVSLVSKATDSDMPDMVIDNGILDLQNSSKKFSISHNNALLLIDTKNTIDEDNLIDYKHGILVGNDRFYIKLDSMVLGFYHPKAEHYVIDKSLVSSIIPALKTTPIISFIFAILAIYLYAIISLAIIAFFANLILNRIGLKYSDIFKMTVHAVTLPAMLRSTEAILGRAVPFSTGIIYAITLLYVNYGIIAIRAKNLK